MKIFRSGVCLSLAAALVALAPGLAPYELFAQTVAAPEVGRAEVGAPGQGFAVPALSGPRALDLRLSPAGLSRTLPALAAPKVKPAAKKAAAGADAVAYPTILPVQTAQAPNAPNNEEGASKAGVPLMAKELAPEIEAAGKIEKAAPEAAPGVGRRILDIILRRKSREGAGDVQAVPIAPATSGLVKAAAVEPKPALPSPPSPVNAILKDLEDNPPAAVIFDYDGTLTLKGPDGISLPVPQADVDAIVELLKKGIPVGFNTGRSLDFQPEGLKISMTLWQPLLSKIPAELRRNIFFAGRLGAEFASFDVQGNPAERSETGWTADEKARIKKALSAALRRAKAARKDATWIEYPGFTNVVFKMGDARAAKFSELLVQEFKKQGLPFQVDFNSKNWVYFSKADKGTGLRRIYAAMKARGLPVTESNLLLLGDEFDTLPGKPAGGDAAGALAFPKSRAVSVGPPAEVMPANVRRLGVEGADGALAAAKAVLEGLAPKQASEEEMEQFYREERARSLRAAAVTLAVMSIPFLWAHAAVAAIAGTILLSLGWIPQIVKNFREGKAATKDLAIGGFLNWFAVSALLTATSILRGANIGWILANLSGVARSLVIIFQMNRTLGDPTILRKTLAVTAAVAAFLAPAFLHLLFPAALWASAAFSIAMGLLMLINWPQIKRNYETYEKDGSVPAGLSWSSVALITVGSALHLIAAAQALDYFWMFNSFLAIVATGALLGQIFFPKATHSLLKTVMPALSKVESAVGSLWGRLTRRAPKLKTA